MIEAYRVGVSLVLNESQLLGGLNKALELFEKISKTVKDINDGAHNITRGLQTARAEAAGMAREMERAARAWERMRGGGSGGTAGGGGGGSNPAYLTPRGSLGALAPYRPFGAVPWGNGGGNGGGSGGFTMPGGGLPGPYTGHNGGRGIDLPPLWPGGNGMNFGKLGGLMMKGMTAVQVVEMVVSSVGHMIDAAKGLNDQLVQLQVMGVKPELIPEIRSKAYEIASNVPGTKTEDIAADIGSLRAVLGENKDLSNPMHDALMMAPKLETIASDMHLTPEMLHAFVRAIELRGGIIDPKTHQISADRFGKEADALYKALTVSAKMLKPNDFLNLMQQAGPMARMVDDPQQFYDMMLTAALDMKGNRAGTALTAAGRQLFGGRMSKVFASSMAKLGLIPENSWTNYGSGYIELNPQAQKQLDAGMTGNGGLFGWTQKVLKPALLAHGYDTDQKQQEELYKITSTETFRRLVGLFLQNSEQVLRDQALMKDVPSPDAALKTLGDKSIGFNLQALQAAFVNWWNAVGELNATSLIGVLKTLTDAMQLLTSAARDAKTAGDLTKKNDFWNHSPIGKDWRQFWIGPTPPAGVQNQSYVPAPRSSTPRVQTITYLQLDGRTIARAVSEEQARHLDLPSSSASRFDPKMSPSYANDTLRI